MTKDFGKDTTKELIQLIRERPSIWDKNDPSYRDRAVKDQDWHNICAIIDPEYKTMKQSVRQETNQAIVKRWYNIRDSYVKTLKLQHQGSSSKSRRPYVYASYLGFLDPAYFQDSSKVVKSEKYNDDTKTDDEEEEITQWENHNIFVEINEESSSIPAPLKLKREARDENFVASQRNNDEEEETRQWNNDIFADITEKSFNEPAAKKTRKTTNDESMANDEIISVLAKLIQREEDEDRAFFKSITPSVKKLSEESKFEFRIQVMNLIKILRKRDSFKTKKVTDDGDTD